MPRVSVLLTCYNHIAYLPQAFESVRTQTFPDFEIIAIDDGSSDGSRDWLAQNVGSLPNEIVILNEENLGTYGTLNKAMEAASGEFFAILNDDDLWEPTKLERQIELLDDHPDVGLVHTDGAFIDGDGRQFDGAPLGFRFPRFETGDILAGLYYENKIIASAALFRRTCIQAVGAFNSDYFGSGDWEMWFRIAEKFRVGFVDERLTCYRVHGQNASHKLDRIWRDDERLREWMRTRYPGLRPRFSEMEATKAMAHNEACLGTIKTLLGKPAEGRAAYRESLALMPGRWKSRLRYAATYLPHSMFRRLLRL